MEQAPSDRVGTHLTSPLFASEVASVRNCPWHHFADEIARGGYARVQWPLVPRNYLRTLFSWKRSL